MLPAKIKSLFRRNHYLRGCLYRHLKAVLFFYTVIIGQKCKIPYVYALALLDEYHDSDKQKRQSFTAQKSQPYAFYTESQTEKIRAQRRENKILKYRYQSHAKVG